MKSIAEYIRQLDPSRSGYCEVRGCKQPVAFTTGYGDWRHLLLCKGHMTRLKRMAAFIRIRNIVLWAGNDSYINGCLGTNCINSESKPVNMPTWRLLLNMGRADKRRRDAKS